MARERLAKFNVVATYADMEAARRAISALERAGVDGDDISLIGRQVDVVAHEQDTRERDAHLTGDIAEQRHLDELRLAVVVMAFEENAPVTNAHSARAHGTVVPSQSGTFQTMRQPAATKPAIITNSPWAKLIASVAL